MMSTPFPSAASHLLPLIACFLFLGCDIAVRVRAGGLATIRELGDDARFGLKEAVVDECMGAAVGLEGGHLKC